MNADEDASDDETSGPSEGRGRRKKWFTVAAKYLILPVQNEARNARFTLHIDGEAVLQYEIALAPGGDDADWYAFFSLERFQGRTAEVAVSSATDEGFALVRQSDTIPGQASFYQERYLLGSTSHREPVGSTIRTASSSTRANTISITSTIPRHCLGAT